MDAWVLWVIGLAVVALPFLLMQLFNHGDVTDSRGRRRSSTWRVRRQKI